MKKWYFVFLFLLFFGFQIHASADVLRYSARSYYYNGDEIEIPIYVALDENILSLEVDFDFSEEVSFLDFTSDYQILESNQDGISLSFADGVGNQDLIGTLKIKISDGLKAYERLVLNFRNITYTNSIGHPVAATEDESVSFFIREGENNYLRDVSVGTITFRR